MNFDLFKTRFEKKIVLEEPNLVPDECIVSVIVQAYNHEAYISQCIESILIQKTNFKFEVLIGEDDSTDRTREICKSYALKYPQVIRLFQHHKENKIFVRNKLTGNFNTLYNIYSARGKYVAVCEGDDFWNDEEKLQKQFDFMQLHSEYSICFHNFNLVDDKGKALESDAALPLKKDLTSLELQIPFVHPATLTVFYRNTFKSLPDNITDVVTLDVYLYSLLGIKGAGKYLENIKSASYRVHQNGLWSKRVLDSKLEIKINTYIKLLHYYQSIETENNYICGIFLTRILKLKKYRIYLNLKKLNALKLARISISLLNFTIQNLQLFLYRIFHTFR